MTSAILKYPKEAFRTLDSAGDKEWPKHHNKKYPLQEGGMRWGGEGYVIIQGLPTSL